MLTIVLVGAVCYLAGFVSAVGGVVWWAKRKMRGALAPGAPLVAPPGFKLKAMRGGGRS